jgi:putative ABC transport system permease protein
LLVIAEVALSFTLLIGGGLLLRSFVQLQKADAGMGADAQQVLTVGVAPTRVNIANSDEMARSYRHRYARMMERVRRLPGVISAGVSDALPPDRSNDYDTFRIEGLPWTDAAFPAATVSVVSGDYFQTLGIPLREGRYFTEADTERTPAVVIISERLARQYFPNSSPIGRHFAQSGPDLRNDWMVIAGVVGDVKYNGLDSPAGPAYYLPYTQTSWSSKLNLVVRSPIAATLTRQIEQEIHAVDPTATLSDVGTLEAVRWESVAQPRFRTALIAGFAGIALLLSAIGIYGVIAYTVTQRTNEIGIRMALGARQSNVLGQIVGSGVVLVLAGIGIGCAGALALTRVLTGMLYSTSSTDPVIFVSVAGILMAVALAASVIPAMRATKIDPIVALRYE